MSTIPQRADLVQVVVVEDNADDALLTMRALSKLKPAVSVKLVRDGAEALELLVGNGACRPQLIFLDLKLPKVHGLEVLRLLREDPASRKIPVVVLTSSDDPRDIAKAKEFGAERYIRKPIDWELYANAICEVAETLLSSVSCGL